MSFFVVDYSENNFAGLLAGAGPVNLGAARLEVAREFGEVRVQMVYRFPFDFRGRLTRGFPILKGGFGVIAGDLVFAQGSLDQLAMTQIMGNAVRLSFEFLGGA